MRLATFNILHGRSPVDGEVVLDRFAAAVGGLDADVLALQEVDRDQPRSHMADLTSLAAASMGAPEHRFVATLHGMPGVWTAATGVDQPSAASYGIALLSRHPVVSWRTVVLPALPGRVPVLFPDRRRPVLVRDEQRAALVAEIDAPGGRLTVAATHLTFVPGWNALQLRRLAWLLRRAAGAAVIMGDLNLEGRRPERITGWTGLASARTFPVGAPTQQLDHILARGAIRAAGEGRSLDVGLSDHRALVVDVELGG